MTVATMDRRGLWAAAGSFTVWGLMPLYWHPVSYTHLDVYKRQGYRWGLPMKEVLLQREQAIPPQP